MRVGLLFLLVGAAVLGGYGAYALARYVVLEPEVPLALRIGLPVVGLGVLVMLGVALWDRLRARAREARDYKEVEP